MSLEDSLTHNLPSDNRSLRELTEMAWEKFEEKDEDFWDIIEQLQFRGTDEIFDLGQKLCQSSDPDERELGVVILSQNLVPGKTFGGRAGPVLLEMLKSEKEDKVLGQIGVSLGHLHDERGIEPLARIKNHPNPDVRFGVVMGLLNHENQRAIDTLVELTRDEDDEVRDWATFGLGSMIGNDTDQIRQALFERTMDQHDDTRGEALVGLAVRKDNRVIEPILKELKSGNVGKLAVEAAKEISSYQLFPVLLELKSWWDVDPQLLDEAIQNCKPH